MSYKEIHIDDFNKVFLKFKSNLKRYIEMRCWMSSYALASFYNENDHLTVVQQLFYNKKNKRYLQLQSIRLIKRNDISIKDFYEYLSFVFSYRGGGEVKFKSDQILLDSLKKKLTPKQQNTTRFSDEEFLEFQHRLDDEVARKSLFPHISQKRYIEILYELLNPPFSFSYFNRLYLEGKN